MADLEYIEVVLGGAGEEEALVGEGSGEERVE